MNNIIFLVPTLVGESMIYEKYDGTVEDIKKLEEVGIKMDGNTVKIVHWDIHYEMSDDTKVWEQGLAQEKMLRSLFVK